MKPSGDGSPLRSVISKLRNLRIELCNLIVESRKPGFKESGYGDGVHCPSLSGSNNHRCNTSNTECLRHQKISQRLQGVQSAACFEVEVFLLPECCVKDQDCKSDEKLAVAEYVLLEKWHISYTTPFFAKPIVDVQGLLRAVRSFLHFSQLSAWLNSHQGKSPSNIHYRVKVPGDAFSSKFDSKPDVHIFPVVGISDSLCGMVRVSYRPRTSQVPIIPCVKHRVIINVNNNESSSSDHALLQECNVNGSDAVAENNKLNSVKMTKSRTGHLHSSKRDQISVQPLKERVSYSKKFSNQVAEDIGNETNKCYPDIHCNSKEIKEHSSPVLKSNSLAGNNINSSFAKKNFHTLPSSQDNTRQNCPKNSNNTKRKLSKKFQGIIKHKIRKLSDNCISPTKTISVPNSENITSMHMTESKPRFSIIHDNMKNDIIKQESALEQTEKTMPLIFEPRTKSQREINVIKTGIQVNKRSFSSVHKNKNNDVNQNASQSYCKKSKEIILFPQDNLPLSISGSVKQSGHKEQYSQETLDQNDGQLINEICATVSSHKRYPLHVPKSRVLRDMKNTLQKLPNGFIDVKCKEKLKNSDEVRSFLPLPSSPIPLRKPVSSLNSLVVNHKALFQDIANRIQGQALSSPKPCKNLKLVINFEESILNGRLQPVNIVNGFTADIGASGSFCPDHMTLPAEVYFYELGGLERGTSPYMGHVNLNELEYHVPKKGAVQVTLFNPHGTVVKMFVVNYNLSDMPPMCHTFVRQRTFYMPTCATEKDPSSGKFLRYIIHLRFASSKTGKIYLYRDFKIVVINKSDVDAASIHSQWQYELRSFIQAPTNPPFSALS